MAITGGKEDVGTPVVPGDVSRGAECPPVSDDLPELEQTLRQRASGSTAGSKAGSG